MFKHFFQQQFLFPTLDFEQTLNTTRKLYLYLKGTLCSLFLHVFLLNFKYL